MRIFGIYNWCPNRALLLSEKTKQRIFSLSDPLHIVALKLVRGQNGAVESLRSNGGKLREIHRMLANALNAYTNLGSRRCTCEPNFAAGAGLTIERQHVSPRFPRQVEPTTAADTLKIVLLGDEVSFDCAVESADVTEVSIWWQKDEANLTISDEEKYSLKVTAKELLFSIFFIGPRSLDLVRSMGQVVSNSNTMLKLN